MPQVVAGVAQNIDQLQSLTIAHAQFAHLGFGTRREILHVRETKPSPEFTHAAGDQVSVFIELGGVHERCDLTTSAESFQVEPLSPVDLLEHAADFVPIAGLQFVEPIEKTRKL